MSPYVIVIAALVFAVGVPLALHFKLGKRVDAFVNSLPLGKQVLLLVLALAVLAVLLTLVGR